MDTTDGSITVDAGGAITATDVVAVSGDSVTLSTTTGGVVATLVPEPMQYQLQQLPEILLSVPLPQQLVRLGSLQQPDRSMMPQMIIPQTLQQEG